MFKTLTSTIIDNIEKLKYLETNSKEETALQGKASEKILNQLRVDIKYVAIPLEILMDASPDSIRDSICETCLEAFPAIKAQLKISIKSLQ